MREVGYLGRLSRNIPVLLVCNTCLLDVDATIWSHVERFTYIYIPLTTFAVKIYFRHIYFKDSCQISIGYFPRLLQRVFYSVLSAGRAFHVSSTPKSLIPILPWGQHKLLLSWAWPYLEMIETLLWADRDRTFRWEGPTFCWSVVLVSWVYILRHKFMCAIKCFVKHKTTKFVLHSDDIFVLTGWLFSCSVKWSKSSLNSVIWNWYITTAEMCFYLQSNLKQEEQSWNEATAFSFKTISKWLAVTVP